MPDPDAATTAAADALRENRRQSIWLPQEPGWATRIAGIAVAAARPVIAAEAAAAQHDESRAIYEEEMRRDLPACPHCGCRTSSEADVRDCGCDSGCNDGEWAPGVNVLVAEAAAAERQRIRQLAIDKDAQVLTWREAQNVTEAFMNPAGITTRTPFADLLDGDAAVSDPIRAQVGHDMIVIRRSEYEELLEIKASAEGRFRHRIIIKADRDRDLYVGWSNVVEAPTWAGTRAEALAEGCPESRLRRADETGTSQQRDPMSSYTGPLDGAWDDTGFIAEQRGFLPRARLAGYVIAYMEGRMEDCWDLLEPFDDETEVRRG